MLVSKCMPVIKIERPCAVLSGIDTKFQRPGGGFIGALDEWLERQDASSPDRHRQGVEYRMDSGRRGEAGSRGCGDNINDRRCRRRSGSLEPSPEVVPLTFWERYGVVIGGLSEWRWSDQQAGSQEELRIETIELRGRWCEDLWKLEEHGTHDRNAGTRGFIGKRVDVRQQTIAGFDVAAANGFLLRAVDPDFVRQRALLGVIAIEGIEGCNLNPSRKQVRPGRAVESTDVGTNERNAAEAEVEQHLGCEAEVIPGRGIISGPGKSVALPTRVCCAGEDEGTLVGTQLEKALVSAARILKSNDIVNFGMRRGASHEARLFDAVNGIQGHGFAWSVKDRGLVHIIPEAGNSILDELLVETPPPLTRAGAREVRKHRRAGPDDTYELAAIGVLYEMVARRTALIGGVALAGRMGDAQVGNCDQRQMLLAAIRHQPRKVGKGSRIDGEWPVLVRGIDVKIEHVGRDLVGAKAVGDLPDFGFRSVAIARLLEAKSP